LAVVKMRSMARECAGRSGRHAVVMTTFLAVALVAMFMLSNAAEAASGPKQVRGVVRDVDGKLIEGIPMTINIRWAGNDTVRSTLTDTSDETGYFSVTFGPAAWDIGDRIQVIGTHSGNQESNSTIANVAPMQWCNITFPYAIPEFGSLIGFVIAGGLVAAVATVFLVSKRKK